MPVPSTDLTVLVQGNAYQIVNGEDVLFDGPIYHASRNFIAKINLPWTPERLGCSLQETYKIRLAKLSDREFNDGIIVLNFLTYSQQEGMMYNFIGYLRFR